MKEDIYHNAPPVSTSSIPPSFQYQQHNNNDIFSINSNLSLRISITNTLAGGYHNSRYTIVRNKIPSNTLQPQHHSRTTLTSGSVSTSAFAHEIVTTLCKNFSNRVFHSRRFQTLAFDSFSIDIYIFNQPQIAEITFNR